MRYVPLLLCLLKLASCLPIVDPGLFVIMGVRSCRAGEGYCLLGLDCTLDEDFLPDDQGGHCDGLRSAFTPSAHFICCRYNAVNRTVSSDKSPATLPLPTPEDMGQDITDNGLGLLMGPETEDDNYPSGEDNFVENAEDTSDMETDGHLSTQPDIQQNEDSWSLLPSNVLQNTDDNSATTVTDSFPTTIVTTPDSGSSGTTTNHGEVSVTEVTEINSTELTTDIYTTTDSETTSSERSDVTRTRLKTSGSEATTQLDDQSSGVKSASDISDNKTSSGVGNNKTSSDVANRTNSDRPVQARVHLDDVAQMGVLTDTGIVKTFPSVVRAETEILVNGDKTRHRNVEVQNNDVTTAESVTQATYYRTEVYVTVERRATGGVGMVTKSVSRRDTTTDPYLAEEGPSQGSKDTTGSQTKPVGSVLPTELDNSLFPLATAPPISTTQNSGISKDNALSESTYTQDRRVPYSSATETQNFLTHALYEDGEVTTVQSRDDETVVNTREPDSTSRSSNPEPQIPNSVTKPNEDRATTDAEHETTTSAHAQITTSAYKDSDTKTEYIPRIFSKPPDEESNSEVPQTTEGLAARNRAESTTEHTQSPVLSRFNETTVHLHVSTRPPSEPRVEDPEEGSEQTEQFSGSDTTTEDLSFDTRTTEYFQPDTEPTTGDVSVGIIPSSSSEPTTGSHLSSGTQNGNQTLVSSRKEGASKSAVSSEESVTESVPPVTTVHSEIAVLSEGTTVFPGESSESSNPSNAIPGVSAPSPGATSQQTTDHPPPCGVESSGKSHGPKCWLVQFMNPNISSMCVGSYLDSNTIVTSANCISRMFDIGMGKVTLLSAGGAVTPSVMIRDIIVHEEFRNKGVKVLLNDIGLVRLEPRSPMPPAACALCLPNSDLDLMDRHCDETSLGQVKPKSLNPDLQIGSPLVCSGGMLAGVASNRSPEFVFTPIGDYVTWIRTNRKIKDDQNEAWK